MILVHTKSLQLLLGRCYVGLGIFLAVFCLFHHGLRDCTVIEQILGAHISLVGHVFIVVCFQISVERIRNVRALYAHEQ